MNSPAIAAYNRYRNTLAATGRYRPAWAELSVEECIAWEAAIAPLVFRQPSLGVPPPTTASFFTSTNPVNL